MIQLKHYLERAKGLLPNLGLGFEWRGLESRVGSGALGLGE